MSDEGTSSGLRRWPRLTRFALAVVGVTLVMSFAVMLSPVRAGQVDCGTVLFPRYPTVARAFEPATPEEQILIDCSEAAQPRRGITNVVTTVDLGILAAFAFVWFRDRQRRP